METYIPNRACPCPRCRARGIMGPAVLITIGVLFLLDSFGQIRFHYTWPIILIVIGLVKVFSGNAPTSGHRNRWIPAPPVPPPTPPAAPSSTQTNTTQGVGQ